MFAAAALLRRLTALLSIVAMLVAGCAFAQTAAAHASGSAMTAAPAPCEHALGHEPVAQHAPASSLDNCATLCKSAQPDAVVASPSLVAKPIMSADLAALPANIEPRVDQAPTDDLTTRVAWRRTPHAPSVLRTTGRLLI
jgi:hypothetical protein